MSVAARNTRPVAGHSHQDYAALTEANPFTTTTSRPGVGITNVVGMMAALLAALGRATRLGRRDHALILLALETGLSVSELTELTCGSLDLGSGGRHVRCTGNGRKERITPLRRQTRAVLRA